jgi:hypothetical protein
MAELAQVASEGIERFLRQAFHSLRTLPITKAAFYESHYHVLALPKTTRASLLKRRSTRPQRFATRLHPGKSVKSAQKLALFVFTFGLCSSPARAIDENANGISDVFEYKFFGLPIRAEEVTSDPDGDGRNNLAEALLGTNPLSGASFARVNPPTIGGGNATFSFPSTAGIRYQPQTSTDLAAMNPWTDFGSPLAGTGSLLQSAVPLPASNQLFFRL